MRKYLRNLKANPTGDASKSIVSVLKDAIGFYAQINDAQTSDRAEWNRTVASHEPGAGMRRANTADINRMNRTFIERIRELKNAFTEFERFYKNDKPTAFRIIKDAEKLLRDYDL